MSFTIFLIYKDAFIIQKKNDHFLDAGVPTSRVGFVFYHFFQGLKKQIDFASMFPENGSEKKNQPFTHHSGRIRSYISEV